MLGGNNSGYSLDIEQRITAYENRYELPVCQGRENLKVGIVALWAVASVGMAFYAFRRWEGGGLPLTFSDLYERNWTPLDRSAVAGYALVLGLGIYRETFADWQAHKIARDNHQEREYGLLLGEVAVHLNTPQNTFLHTKTKYFKRELYDDAMEYRQREGIEDYLGNLTYEASFIEDDMEGEGDGHVGDKEE